jgi:histidinol-phosphate aminotransferase
MMYKLPDKLKNFHAYVPNEGAFRVRLDVNENHFTPGAPLLEEMMHALRDVLLNRYPDTDSRALCALAADYYGVPPECVIAGVGSNELISLILNAFAPKGGTVALSDEPDFSMYAFYAELNELKICGMEHANAGITIFSNPCNPTGRGIPAHDVLDIVRSREGLVVVDEAYMDFWDQSVCAYVLEHDNLIVLKTCSKSFGLAAIRLGFALAGKTLSNVLKAVKSPFNISGLTQAAGAVMLSRPDWLRESAADTIRRRDALAERCRAFPGNRFTVRNTHTNFILLQAPQAPEWHRKLAERGVAVRWVMGDCLRICVGSDQDHAIFLHEFQAILEESV